MLPICIVKEEANWAPCKLGGCSLRMTSHQCSFLVEHLLPLCVWFFLQKARHCHRQIRHFCQPRPHDCQVYPRQTSLCSGAMSLPLPVGLSDSIKRIIDTPVTDTSGIYKQFKVADSLDLVRTLPKVLSRSRWLTPLRSVRSDLLSKLRKYLFFA